MDAIAIRPMYGDLHRVYRASEHPLPVLLKLVLGVSGGAVLPKPLPSPMDLNQQRDLIWQRYDGIVVLRQIPLFRWRDTAMASLYRMSEFLCADESNQLMLEMQYFWNHPSWTLHQLPDPRDDDAERYAILASLVESLVLAFNYRLKLGLRRDKSHRGSDLRSQIIPETCPSWTTRVTKLDRPLVLYEEDIYAQIAGTTNNAFSDRNIVANAGNLFSI
jgi:hypothetical protein